MTRAETISSVAVTAESGSPNRPSAASPVALLLALAIHATCCMAFGGSASKITPAAPAPGSDAAEVFDSLRQARFEAMKTPPTWVGSLEPLAQRGASRLAAGGNLEGSTNASPSTMSRPSPLASFRLPEQPAWRASASACSGCVSPPSRPAS